MSEIYKIIHYTKNVKKIYIFHPFRDLKKSDLTSLFASDPDSELFKDIISSTDMKLIKSNNISVKFCDSTIHIDDTIDIIKRKIIKEFDFDISFEEIYLFFQKAELLNSVSLYQKLTQNEKIDLTKQRIVQYLLNIENNELNNIEEDKPIYKYDDILNLNIFQKDSLVKTPIGQKFVAIESTLPYTVNPYDVIEYDPFLSKYAKDITSTTNNELLLSFGDIEYNTIYLCLANEVLEYLNEKRISEETTIQIYFPYLFAEDIRSLDEYNDNRILFIEKTKTRISNNFNKKIESIDLLYDIYSERKTDLKYNKNGISKISFTIHPEYTFNLPIDIVFKLINASESTPLIKYNPSKYQENIYRLYCDKISTTGNKIPYLSRGTIFKLMKSIGGHKCVSVYIEKIIDYNGNSNVVTFICEFEKNGDININANFNEPMKLDELINNIIENVNPIISIVKNFVEQSGYSISLFENFDNTNIEINNILYESNVTIKNNINIKNYQSCISNAFIINEGDLDKGIIMRFKRVSNFNKMDSIDAFIVESINKELREREIINELIELFKLSEENARIKLANLVGQIQLMQNTFQNKKFKVKNNPGFLTSINKDKYSNSITINIDGINNIKYLDIIPIYLDSIIRVTQNIDSTKISSNDINLLCGSKKVDAEDELIEDIIAEPELAFKDNNQLDILSNQLNLSENKEDELDMLDIILGNDDDDEYEEDDITNEKNKYSNQSDNSDLEGGADSDDELEELEGDIEFGEELSLPDSLSSLSEKISNNSSVISKIYTPESFSDEINEENPSIKLGKSVSSIKSSSPIVTQRKSSSIDEDTSKSKSISEKDLKSKLEVLPKLTSISPSLSLPSESENTKSSKIKFSIKSLKSKLPSKSVSETPSIITDETDVLRDITGMSLNNPNPFFNRLKSRDSKLFLVKKEGNFKAYSRTCPSNARRQPVILSDKEKEKIDKEHPGSYDKAIKYGSNPDKQFWYICPRYWSLKENISLTEAQVKSGKYGKIIPLNAKKIPKGAYIYEFTDKKGEYIKHYPGFLKANNHPDKLCVPCCFNSWDSTQQVNRRNQCIIDSGEKEIQAEEDLNKDTSKIKKKYKIKGLDIEEPKTGVQGEILIDDEEEEERPDIDSVPPTLISKTPITEMGITKIRYKVKKTDMDEYIKGPEKFPLEPRRWGYLPYPLQQFLNTDNTKCYVSNINKNLKPNHICLLRHGVEYNENQSFISCIADAYSDIYKSSKPLSIIEFKKVLINSLSLDLFITLQNGNLIKVFENKDKDVIINDIYKSSKLYKSINKSNENDIDFFNTVINSYELFIEYLNDDNVLIDHKYLWDLISKSNIKLFPKGINIVILEILNEDITNNISLLCPSNHYSNELFDINKKTLILMKNDKFYEPIYTLEDKVDKWVINRLFNLNNKDLLPNIRSMLYVIKTTYSKKCIPFSSVPTVYKFKQNLVLNEILMNLKSIKYDIHEQVMNYNGKIIGLLVSNKLLESGKINIKCFVPIYPSSPNPDLNIIMMDLPNIWNDFQSTVDFLIQLSNDSNKRIPCLPKIKILEDGLIVGLLTETNQFISTSEPEQNNMFMDMESIDNENYLIPDIKSQTSKLFDNDRIKYIKRIKLENQFYIVFRSIVRILLGQFKFRDLRKIIEDTIDNKYLLYRNKIERISQILDSLTSENVSFKTYSDDELMKIDSVTNCNVSKECNALYCATSNGNICKLVISKLNLINNKDNEEIYFIKLADELIRYNRIKDFIFQPKAFLSFSDVKYNLNDNEIILLQSLITQEYFADLVPELKNTYINVNNSYDIMNPLESQLYSNKVELNNNLIKEATEFINKESILRQNQVDELELESKLSDKIVKDVEELLEKEQGQEEEKEGQEEERKEEEEETSLPISIPPVSIKSKLKFKIVEEEKEEGKKEEEEISRPISIPPVSIKSKLKFKIVEEEKEAEAEEGEEKESEIEAEYIKHPIKEKKIRKFIIRRGEEIDENELPTERMIETVTFCDSEEKSKVSGKIKKLLPGRTKEIIFSNNTTLCTFDILKVLIKDHTGIDLTKSKIREELLNEYLKLNEYIFQILEILLKQGKKLAKQVQSGQIRVEDFILSNSYYITNLDIWIMAIKYNIPIVFLSKTSLLENKEPLLVAYSDGSEKYYFIKSPIMNLEILPQYVLFNYKDSYKISLSDLKPNSQLYVRENENKLPFYKYISGFSNAILKKPKKIKIRFKIIKNIENTEQFEEINKIINRDNTENIDKINSI
jgi:hypothetical protein